MCRDLLASLYSGRSNRSFVLCLPWPILGLTSFGLFCLCFSTRYYLCDSCFSFVDSTLCKGLRFICARGDWGPSYSKLGGLILWCYLSGCWEIRYEPWLLIVVTAIVGWREFFDSVCILDFLVLFNHCSNHFLEVFSLTIGIRALLRIWAMQGLNLDWKSVEIPDWFHTGSFIYISNLKFLDIFFYRDWVGAKGPHTRDLQVLGLLLNQRMSEYLLAGSGA